MMKNISLLPPEIEARWRAQQKRRRYLLGGGLALLVFLAVYAALIALTFQAQLQVRALQAQRAAVQKEIAAYQEYAAMQARITSADNLLQQAVGTPPDWVQLMTGVSRFIPPDVWLTDFTAAVGAKEAGTTKPAPARQATAPQSRPEAGEVTLRGWAFDHQAVARWLEEIRRVPGLTDVRCQFATEDTLQQKAMVKFEIKAAVLPGPPYRPAAGKDE
ncbi:MAG: PilN domain-containing protein [Bacillota bacterium]